MKIPSGSTDRKIFFVGVDSSDLKTRKTGLSSFTVYRSRDGGSATVYTTPTVAELSSSNMPGVYSLVLDEDTTIGGTHDTEEYCVHITCATMAPVTRVIELYRVKFTEGQSATMASSRVDTNVVAMAADVVTASAIASDAIGSSEFAQAAADKVWSSATRTLTAFSTALALSVWDVLLANISTATSVGKKLKDWTLGSDNKSLLSSDAHTGAVIPTVTTLTGHTPQTGDSYLRIGATGSGLTSLASQASVTTIDDFVDSEIAALQTDVTAIKGKTDNLPSDPADASDIASSFTTVNGKLDVIDDFLDTEIAAIKAVTDALAYKKNAALANFEFVMTDDTTHLPQVGLVDGDFTKKVSIDGGAEGTLTNSISEVGNGIYKVSLTSGEMNGKTITLRFAAAATDTVIITLVTNG